MQDVDASEFAWGLLNLTAAYFHDVLKKDNIPTPMHILNNAHLKIIHDKKINLGKLHHCFHSLIRWLTDSLLETGSSTACVAVIQHLKARMSVLNVGDSGYILFRERRIIFHSKEHQRGYNFPYQLSPLMNTDSALEGDQYNDIPLLPNDIVLLASDGLFDNLYDKQIEPVLNEYMDEREDMLRRKVTDPAQYKSLFNRKLNDVKELAKRWAQNQNWESPFAAYTRRFPERPQIRGG